MRRIVVHMQSTLNGCIANAQGTFWQPFPWGDPEQAHINEVFRAADTIVLSRVMYEAIVPWWEIVAAGQVPDDVPEVSATFQEFAGILSGLRKVVISRTWPATDGRPVINGDLVAELQDHIRVGRRPLEGLQRAHRRTGDGVDFLDAEAVE